MPRKRSNSIPGQFSARLIEMLESPAWRALSLSAHRVIDRFRRVATRFEKTARNYRAVVTLAAIVLWMR
jgi:hypothetical protein